jgi:hypothetical protein
MKWLGLPGESLWLWSQNKVVPQMALYDSQMYEINLNLSRSQNCSWDPRTGITGKIKSFPDE